MAKSNQIKFAATLLLSMLAACGVATKSQNEARFDIVGGRPVQANEALAKSAVFFTDHEGNFGCSGVVIGPGQVLSAAHCFNDEEPWYDVHVAFALNADEVRFTGADSNVRKVTRVFRHEGYNATFSDRRIPPFDISLVLFEGSIPVGHEAAPILPLDYDLKVGEKAMLVGYGKTGDTLSDSGILRTVETFVGKIRTREKEIEFGPNRGRGACGGDSGGPAFVNVRGKNYLLATTSRGPSDSCSDGNVIHTDVRYFTDWIDQHSASLED